MENPAVNAAVGVSAISSDPQKWRTLLNQFEDVLKTNIFIVDPAGRILVPLNSSQDRQAGSPLQAFGLDLSLDYEEGGGLEEFWSRFESVGTYLQAIDPAGLRLFAVPIKNKSDTLFYLLAGPLFLDMGRPDQKYLNAVLDLLAEVVKDIYELAIEKQKLIQVQGHSGSLRPDMIDAVRDLLADIQHDELLVAILDSAIKMAGAAGGSIMMLDKTKQDFVVKVSRGLDNKKNTRIRFKSGEGIAGIAAQEKTPFFISGMEGDERIRHLLKRPDIKQSFVVPIVSEGMVMGVLNLSIKKEDGPASMIDVQQDIQKFSPLIAAALRSL